MRSNPRPDAATQAHLSASYGQLPLSFEANKGQTDSRVNFLSRGSGYALFLTSTRAVLSLKHGDTSNVVGMRVIGASPASRADDLRLAAMHKQSGIFVDAQPVPQAVVLRDRQRPGESRTNNKVLIDEPVLIQESQQFPGFSGPGLPGIPPL